MHDNGRYPVRCGRAQAPSKQAHLTQEVQEVLTGDVRLVHGLTPAPLNLAATTFRAACLDTPLCTNGRPKDGRFAAIHSFARSKMSGAGGKGLGRWLRDAGIVAALITSVSAWQGAVSVAQMQADMQQDQTLHAVQSGVLNRYGETIKIEPGKTRQEAFYHDYRKRRKACEGWKPVVDTKDRDPLEAPLFSALGYAESEDVSASWCGRGPGLVEYCC